MTFKLILNDMNVEMCKAFKRHFSKYPKVNIVQGDFRQVSEFDCLVSPANSYGMMDGGMDKYIIDFFGERLMKDVQEFIIANYAGLQPVGTSFVIETGSDKHPFLAHTPTMRVPTNIQNTINPYLAMKAMLLAVEDHNEKSEFKINSVLCPGLGTGAGGMAFDEAAYQMSLAYEHVKKPPKEIDWQYVVNRESSWRWRY